MVVLWTLVAVYAGCIIIPVVLFLRLPKPLVPPESEESPEFAPHIAALSKRLKSNPYLEGAPLSGREDVEEALDALDGRVDDLVRRTGSQVFVTTAISQNGSLDAFLVLAAQSKLVWQISHVYYQRPTVRDLLFLYANVASTAFVASELEDIDVAEQLQPVLASVLGSAAGAVPGLQAASSIVVNSAMTGAANAFLTMRVGIIAKTYSSALVLPSKRDLRRSAMASAAKMLGGVAAEGTKRISGAVFRASGRKVGGVVTGVGRTVKDSGSWLTEKLRRGEKEPKPEEQS